MTLDSRLASESDRVATASRAAGLQHDSESNLGVGLPVLRVDCVLGWAWGVVSQAFLDAPRLASRTC
eukprot:3503030-Alexandrium_andersonii.AAC.1